MIVMVDRMAQKYGLLPSEVMDRATTFDLVVMDMTHTWERMIHDKSSGKTHTPNVKQETLELILEKHRENKN